MYMQNAIKTIVGIALLAMSLFVVPQALFADVDIANARIHRIGIDPRFVGPFVQLDDLAANEYWTGNRVFYLSPDLGNSGYATLLTAFSMGLPVWVRIADDASRGSLITIIYSNAPAP